MSLLLIACSTDEITAEQQVRNLIMQLESSIESGSTRQALELLDDDYSDEKHRDKKAAARSLFAYMHRHRRIHIFSMIRQIEIAEDGAAASVIVQTALTGEAVESKESLFSIKADIYRFTIELRLAGERWLIHSAQWQRDTLDLLPG